MVGSIAIAQECKLNFGWIAERTDEWYATGAFFSLMHNTLLPRFYHYFNVDKTWEDVNKNLFLILAQKSLKNQTNDIKNVTSKNISIMHLPF